LKSQKSADHHASDRQPRLLERHLCIDDESLIDEEYEQTFSPEAAPDTECTVFTEAANRKKPLHRKISSNVNKIQQFYLQERELFPAYKTLDEENFAANRNSHGPDLLLREEEDNYCIDEADCSDLSKPQIDQARANANKKPVLGASHSVIHRNTPLLMTLTDHFSADSSFCAASTSLPGIAIDETRFSRNNHKTEP